MIEFIIQERKKKHTQKTYTQKYAVFIFKQRSSLKDFVFVLNKQLFQQKNMSTVMDD